MRRAIVRVIARRAVWTAAYVAAVFLLVAALGYAEWRWETQSWTRRLSAPSAAARARAMSEYGLRVSRLPHPVPCASLARGLGDAPEVRREALPAVVRVVRTGSCVEDVVEMLRSSPDPSVRISAARALAFTPARHREEIRRVLAVIATERDSVGTAALETLHELDVIPSAARDLPSR